MEKDDFNYHKLCKYQCYQWMRKLNRPAREIFSAQRMFHKKLFSKVAKNDDEQDIVVMLQHTLFLSSTKKYMTQLKDGPFHSANTDFKRQN